MARVKSVSAIRHRKVLKEARGFKQARRTRIKTAKEALLHAGKYAYIGRKARKKDLRSLWIMRLNAAVREHGISYSKFVNFMKLGKVEVDRKILSDIAVKDSEAFKEIVEATKSFSRK